MGTVATLNAASLSTYSTLTDPYINAQVWNRQLQRGVSLYEWLSKFEGGEGSQKPIIVAQDLAAKGADQVNFTVGARLVGPGKKGADTLRGNEEQQIRTTYKVKVDWVRHATAHDLRAEEFIAAGGFDQTGATKLLAEWMADKKQMEGLLKIVRAATNTSTGKLYNLVYAGGGDAQDDITDADVLSTALIDRARSKAITNGCRPSNISNTEGDEIREFVMWGTHRALRGLRQDDEWKSFNTDARARESGWKSNPLITGSYGSFYGVRLYEYFLDDHDNLTNGPIGCPMEPRALLRTAITSSATTVVLGGGSAASVTTIPYFRDFPGYSYTWTTGNADASDSETRYLKIINMAGSTDAGKYEVCSYTGSTNNGASITSLTRGVGYNADIHSYRHDADSLIVPCNQNGVAYSNVILCGAMALLRAYGSRKEEIKFQLDDYEFVKGASIQAIFGQEPAQRADSRYPNFIVNQVRIDPLT